MAKMPRGFSIVSHPSWPISPCLREGLQPAKGRRKKVKKKGRWEKLWPIPAGAHQNRTPSNEKRPAAGHARRARRATNRMRRRGQKWKLSTSLELLGVRANSLDPFHSVSPVSVVSSRFPVLISTLDSFLKSCSRNLLRCCL